jgi:hypothetical protein
MSTRETFCARYNVLTALTPTVWPVSAFPAQLFPRWSHLRLLQAAQAWAFFEEVEAADGATRVSRSGPGYVPPQNAGVHTEPSIWHRITGEGALLRYQYGKRLHQILCPDYSWKSQRDYGLSAAPVVSVYPVPCWMPVQTGLQGNYPCSAYTG